MKSYSTRASADAVALANNNTDEDGWKYEVISIGVAFVIRVSDEYGNYLGTF